ncbi:MAG: hypothetical protein GF410_02500 [Chitinivibrionales bacterium]|nr:hypothetical protein [Chitinivibrionales bacterium]
MKAAKALDEHVRNQRGMTALYKELGPAEARRFIATLHDMPHEDSVKRHRRWQASLDKKAFVKRIMAAQRS